jgi:hypothetical protein
MDTALVIRWGRLASCLLSACFVVLIAGMAGGADQKPLQNPVMKRFYAEMKMLVRRNYPKATSHLLKNNIHFEHDTMLFIVHIPLKSGEWQDPQEERGPNANGILCDITLESGRYGGQAVVPQTLEGPYFQTLLMAPYSSNRDEHLYVRLRYPNDVNAAFLKEFSKLVNDFEKYLD